MRPAAIGDWAMGDRAMGDREMGYQEISRREISEARAEGRVGGRERRWLGDPTYRLYHLRTRARK